MSPIPKPAAIIATRTSEGCVEPLFGDGFGEVVDRFRLEGGKCELLECGDEDDEWCASVVVASAGDVEA